MKASFRAYIDESGDEGFKFRANLKDQSSSDWFVLSAYLTRMKYDLETVKVIDEVRAEFSLPQKKHVHWKDLKHPQKVRYAQIIAGRRGRIVAVCVHKPSLLEPEKFRERYRLYFYAARYLLERITWLAREFHNPEEYGGDGTIELLFSNRQGMSYEELRSYLSLLKTKKIAGQDIQIEFDLLPIDKISALTPGRSMGLQLADAAAGAMFNALERDSFGNTEPRYIQTIAPILYRHRGELLSYGLKFVPRETKNNLINEKSLDWLWSMK